MSLRGLEALPDLPGRLRAAGAAELARRVERARVALGEVLEDESESAPDWEPFLHALRREEVRGLRLLGLSIPPAWEALYPAQEGDQ